MINGEQLMKALQVGACPTVNAQPVEVVVRQQNDEAICCADETKSTTLDAEKFFGADCPAIIWEIINVSDENSVIAIGGPGMAGLYQLYGTEANASDNAEVRADDDNGAGFEPNVIPIQFVTYMAHLGGILVTGVNVTVNSNTPNQANQKLRKASIGLDREECRHKVVHAVCPACPNPVVNANMQGVVQEFNVCMIIDAMHWLEYTILAAIVEGDDTNITLEVFYAGYGASVHDLAPCGGGKVLSAVPAIQA